jgi:hypothetical protein
MTAAGNSIAAETLVPKPHLMQAAQKYVKHQLSTAIICKNLQAGMTAAGNSRAAKMLWPVPHHMQAAQKYAKHRLSTAMIYNSPCRSV